MLSNGAEPITSSDIVTANVGNATTLNDKIWNFTISYENGDSGDRGFTFTLTDGSTTSTLVYDAANPLNNLTPTGDFNAIQIQARAGVLPGDTQASTGRSSRHTKPKLVGFQMCRPPVRSRNLLAMVTVAPSTATHQLPVRSKRQSDKPEIKALRGSNRGRRHRRVHSHWHVNAVPSSKTTRPASTSKSRASPP